MNRWIQAKASQSTSPGSLAWISGILAAVHDQRLPFEPYRSRERPVDRVVSQQVGKGIPIGDVHDRSHGDPGVPGKLAEDVAADPAEPHQTDRHLRPLVSKLEAVGSLYDPIRTLPRRPYPVVRDATPYRASPGTLRTSHPAPRAGTDILRIEPAGGHNGDARSRRSQKRWPATR